MMEVLLQNKGFKGLNYIYRNGLMECLNLYTCKTKGYIVQVQVKNFDLGNKWNLQVTLLAIETLHIITKYTQGNN